MPPHNVEGKEFSKIGFYVQYFKRLVEDRKQEFGEALRGVPPDANFPKIWREHIFEVYKQHGWYKPVGLGRMILDP